MTVTALQPLILLGICIFDPLHDPLQTVTSVTRNRIDSWNSEQVAAKDADHGPRDSPSHGSFGAVNQPTSDFGSASEEDLEKGGGSTPEMRVTSTTVQQANVYRVIVHVFRKKLLYNGYNMAGIGVLE